MDTFFVNIQLTVLTQGKRLRVRPLEGQASPVLWVSCSRTFRSLLPVGSIFTADLKLIESQKRKPYLVAIKRDYHQLRLF
jgi:hypothetical protein